MQAAVKFCISSRPARFIRPLNRMATRTFTEKKYNNNKDDSFFRLNFNVFLNVDNRERAEERDKKTKRPNRENFIAAVRRWEMLAASKVKMTNER